MALNIEKLKQAKKRKGLSYDDLARITGYSRSTITNIFCGYIDLPRHETVQAIEQALGLSPQFTSAEAELGVNLQPKSMVLSDRQHDWIATLNRAEEAFGAAYVDKYLELLDIAVQQKPKK